ncbi:MAG: hypothetical protein WC383_14320 [Gammaproteobacteria bacterium]
MAPRKKQYATKTEKQRAYEKRLRESGRRRVCVWLDEATTEKLDRLATAKGIDRGAVIEALTAKAKEPK